MNYSIISVCIVILVVCAIFSKSIQPEHFALPDDEVPMKGVNLCGRNIVFPYFARNNFTASQRAMPEYNLVSTFPLGKCRFDPINGIQNESHSIVHENSLFYNLKAACMGFRIKNIDIKNGGNLVYVTFDMSDNNDIDNVMSFVLLHPLYIEFAINSKRTTSGYRLQNQSFVFSSASGMRTFNKDLTLAFVAIEDTSKSSCDKTFNYKELSPQQTVLNMSDADYIRTNDSNTLNLKVYFLDALKSSFQNIGRSISPKNQNGQVVVFDKNYQNYFTDKFSTQLYEFMNNIALMYTNHIYPVFTFNFSINVSERIDGNKILIQKVYMNNGVGYYNTCYGIQDQAGGVTNNNILSTVIEGVDSNSYNIHFYTGADNKCFFGGTNTLSFRLPYLSRNNINISVTVSPNEKVALAYWQDNSIHKQVVFAKKQDCVQNNSYDVCLEQKERSDIDNSFYKLFVELNGGSRTPLENIFFNYNTNYVKNVESIHLGYTNLLRQVLF
jgi:hypothetical protein